MNRGRRIRFVSGAFAGAIVGCLYSIAANADEWSDAANAVVRASPNKLTMLPRPIVHELARQGCDVPQPRIDDGRPAKVENVSIGSFARRGQRDYAVLCSIAGKSHIQVFWGGKARCASSFAEGEDINYLQRSNKTLIAYSRAIYPASQREIAYFQKARSGPKPPDTSHQGIGDHFLGKSSVIYYCAKGHWIELHGMD
jgi:hypothetical protein